MNIQVPNNTKASREAIDIIGCSDCALDWNWNTFPRRTCTVRVTVVALCELVRPENNMYPTGNIETIFVYFLRCGFLLEEKPVGFSIVLRSKCYCAFYWNTSYILV